MVTNIYQTWLQRLGSSQDSCIYSLRLHNPDGDFSIVSKQVSRVFQKEPGKGAETAAYKIDANPNEIEIELCLQGEEKRQDGYSIADTLLNLSEEEISKKLVEQLWLRSNPRYYGYILAQSNKAIVQMLSDESLIITDENGTFVNSLEEFAAAYLRCLGIKNIPATVVTNDWFNVLAEDPWWIEAMICTPKPPAAAGMPFPSPLTIAKFARRYGDGLSMLCVFHDAYKAITVAAKRDALISDITNQSETVKKKVCEEWVKRLGGNNWRKVAIQMLEAFRCLQRMKHMSMSYFTKE